MKWMQMKTQAAATVDERVVEGEVEVEVVAEEVGHERLSVTSQRRMRMSCQIGWRSGHAKEPSQHHAYSFASPLLCRCALLPTAPVPCAPSLLLPPPPPPLLPLPWRRAPLAQPGGAALRDRFARACDARHCASAARDGRAPSAPVAAARSAQRCGLAHGQRSRRRRGRACVSV